MFTSSLNDITEPISALLTSITRNACANATRAPTSALMCGQSHGLSEDVINDFSQSLNGLKRNNIDRIFLAHLNINSRRNNLLTKYIGEKMDIFLVSETKINQTFPTALFLISGYSTPFSVYRTNYGGGLLLYVKKHIPSQLLGYKNIDIDKDFECLSIEIYWHSKNWSIAGTYSPSKCLIGKHIKCLSLNIDMYMQKYGNFNIMGDFNSDII